jgi:hypothetical protein
MLFFGRFYYFRRRRPDGCYSSFIEGRRVLPKIDLEKQCMKIQNATDALTDTKNPNAIRA